MNPVLWQPAPDIAAATQIARMAKAQGFEGEDAIARLWRWSIDEPGAFWQAVWDLGEVRASRKADLAFAPGADMKGARWFEGARLNFAENLLDRGAPDAPAMVFRGEDGRREETSWGEMRRQTAALAATLRASGVGEGDRVAGYLPNLPQTIIAMLATSAIGAIWCSASPDFGVSGVLDRFGQIEPKVLIAVDGYFYAGKRLDIREKVAGVASGLPGLRRTILVPFLEPEGEGPDIPHRLDWAEATKGAPGLDFAQLPFDHPLYILFSSGTTGKPKAIVHRAGGVLLQHIKEHRLHCDARPGDRVFYFTTCGWMMWNWLAGGLATGETLILYDGSPFHAKPNVLWDLAAEEKVAIFGTSAKYIDACKKLRLEPARTHDLGSLRAVLSTGSPLVPESFDYVYKAIGKDIQLASISGGTDIVSCFVLGNPAGPVRRGEIQMRGLGMAVEIWNDEGKPVRGEKGELVCTRPFPCMPLGFWNDPDGSRYHESYFARFDGIWCHGDFAELTEGDGIVIHGRSDAVLNPGGVRIGTAEIYRQVEQMEEVQEAICVGQDWQGDVRVVLFVRLKEGHVLDEPLEAEIRRRIRENCTPRHVPARILAIADIPRTRSGKISEIAVRDVIHGRAVKNTDALANPESLKLYENLPQLQT